MKYCKLFCLLAIVIFFLAPAVNGQPVNEPVIGKQCPDFTLKEIYFYPKKEASLTDFKGKWLVLDFWATGCSSCVASFPKINNLQKEFSGRVQFLLIGKTDKYIRAFYKKYREHYALQLTVAYDSILFSRFGIQYVPHIIIVDPQGIVKAITRSSELNEDHILSLLSGKPVAFAGNSNTIEHLDVDFSKPLLLGSNGGDDTSFMYRSLLFPWNPKIPQQLVDFSERFNWSHNTKNGIQITGANLNFLYNIAYAGTASFRPGDAHYYGNYSPFPVLETKDTSLFQFNYDNGKNIFCYSALVPVNKATNKVLQEIMQNDLKNFFGFNVSVENRSMPCWRLIATNEAKEFLKTKGSSPSLSGAKPSSTGFELINRPVTYLMSSIFMYHQLEPPIIDDTGINGNIDIKINAIMTDMNDIKRALRLHGLNLIKGEKIMKVIVIRDASVE